MSTRSTTHFIDSGYIDPKTQKPILGAIVYRHTDGYVKGNGLDLFTFLERCKKLKDSRLNDTSYLASKYVVFLAEMFSKDLSHKDKNGRYHPIPYKDRLEFISVGVVMTDPSDIEYRYTIDCGKIDSKTGLPEVRCFHVSMNDDGTDSLCVEVEIPGKTTVKPVPSGPSAEEWINKFNVVSENDFHTKYTIKQNAMSMGWVCSCPAFQFGDGDYCKHIKANVPVQLRMAGGLFVNRQPKKI
jgi:hypothetical protein